MEIYSINQKKFKDRSKLLTVIIKKIYEKIIKNKGKPEINNNKKLTKENASDLLMKQTSPIAPVFSSNLFNLTSNLK
jgi:hypothetical protein